MTAMILDDLENMSFLDFSSRFLAATHISGTNCAEITRDRSGQPCIKFVALNVDLNSPSLDRLGSSIHSYRAFSLR